MNPLEIITYGNPDALAAVLRGVAYIFGSKAAGVTGDSGYGAAMGIAIIVGFVAALMAYAFAPQKLVGWQWLFSVMLVYTLVFVPKVTVQVVDRLQGFGGDKPTAVVLTVPDVPFGLAVLGYLTSQVGDKLTEAYETVFSGPDSSGPPTGTAWYSMFTYRSTGMMFGTRAVNEISNATFTDPHVAANLDQYLKVCLAHDVGDGTVNLNDINNSPDIWKEILLIKGNPALQVHTSVGELLNCETMQAKLALVLADGGTQDVAMARRMAARLGAGRAGGDEASVLSTIKQAYVNQGLSNNYESGANIMRQGAFINAMVNATTSTGQRGGDPTAGALGTGLAMARISTNSSWITSAQIAQEAMPLIRAGIEVVLYAAFPIVVLMLMVTSGVTTARLIKSYAGALLWIQMWPPLYAVLNHLATIVSARHITAAASSYLKGQTAPDALHSGLTMLTAVSIYDRSVTDMAVVGYLVAAIPMIAWSLVKGMDSIASGALAGSAAFGGGSSAGATAASTGSIKMGMVMQDKYDHAPMHKGGFETREDGNKTQTLSTGGEVLQTTGKTSGGLGLTVGMVDNHASQLQATAAQKLATSELESVKASTAIGATINDSRAAAQNTQLTGTTTHGGTRGRMAADGSTGGTASGAGEGGSRGKAGGVDKSIADAAARKTEMQARAGLDALKAAGISVGGGGGSSAGSSEQRAITSKDIAQKADQWSKMDNKADVLADMKTFVSSDGFQTALANGVSGTSQLALGYSDAATHEKASQAAKTESLELGNAASKIHSTSTGLNQDLTGAFHQSLKASGELDQQISDKDHNPAAAHARAEAFLDSYAKTALHDPAGFATTGEGSRPHVPNPAGLPGFTPEERKAVEAQYENSKPSDEAVYQKLLQGDTQLEKRTADLHIPKPAAPNHDGSGILAEVAAGQGKVAEEIVAKEAAVDAATLGTQKQAGTILSAAGDATRVPVATNAAAAAMPHMVPREQRDAIAAEISGAGTPQPAASHPRTPEETADAAAAVERLNKIVNPE